MRPRLVSLLAVLLVIASACQIQPTPATPTGVATGPSPSAAPSAASSAASPSAAPSNAAAPSAAPDQPIGALAPIDAPIPASFTGADSATFAGFNPPAVEIGAIVETPAIAADLSNVELSVILSPEQRERIARNGFAVSPGETKEFYELYERARYDYVPIFVTSDSLLHVYHLLFDKTLRRAETGFFIPMLTQLDWAMLQTSVAQYEELRGTPWAEAARRNAAYFAVPVKLLNPDWPVPEGLRDLVDPELEQIAAHSAIAPSTIFPAYPLGEDWSQYVPRGHYTKSEELQRYFRAMMWHGRMTFRAADATETRQAALLTLAFKQTKVDGRPAEALWSGIYEPTVFFVGRSDDLTPQEYDGALTTAYGQIDSAAALLDDARFAAFQAEIEKLRPPEILGMVIWRDDPNGRDDTKGLRFMGQRFVPDAFVFGELIDQRVPNRWPPKALDFFAAIGSERALEHLEQSGDTAVPRYSEQLDKLRAAFAEYDEQVWTQNLYWSWIHSLRPLLEPVDERYPQFMRSDAWQDKQLTTALGSWTELKRDTILYAKQVYAEMGAGALPPPTPEPPKGYVEPVPEVFARIAALTQMTIDGLDQRGLFAGAEGLQPEQQVLTTADRQALEAMATIARRLQTMAEKQLRGEALSEEEYQFIRFYGGEIEKLTFAASDEGVYPGLGGGSPSPGSGPAGGEELQAAVVADVATDPNGQVLEEGVGRIFEIYVVAPIEGRLVLTKGGVFSHYEFTQPLSERLTDEAWREMLDAGNAPPLAAWTDSFMVEQNSARPLAETITRFNDALVSALWSTNLGPVEPFLIGAELDDTRAYIEQLQAEGQFVGMKRLSLQFLSFDFQDEQHATVATRELWTDELYRGSPSFERTSEPELVGRRAPYEVTVTYTMERGAESWQISRVVTRPDLPDWQQP